MTAGSAPQAVAGWPVCARAPEFRVSQASAGQVSGWMAKSDREPTEPWPARRQSVGVADAEMSLHRRPGMPTMTTWRVGAAVLAGLAGVAVMTTARAASGPASSAHRAAPSLILT